MQQVVLRQRHQVLLLMHNPLHQQLQQQGGCAANMCNSNRQFQITGYTVQLYFHTNCSISGTGLVTASSGTYTCKLMQQVVRQRHQVLLLMHNPLHQQLNSRNSTQPTCAAATGSFQITGYSASNAYTFTPGVVAYLVQD
jgi:hypothetical protein